MYTIHRPIRNIDVTILGLRGPPSSPPMIGFLLMSMDTMANTAHAQNTHTE